MKSFNIKILIFLFILSQSLVSQELFSVNKIDHSEIQIDGYLSENVWSNTNVLPIGFEVEPANNKPSKRETFVYVLYSSKAIFIAYHAFDEPKNLRASVRSRDQRGFWSDDAIIVHIDTFRDARSNVSLAVNPLGSQFDFLYENFGPRATFNTNFNINYESAGRITDNGYIVEMKIPFSELAFDNNTDQIWNMRFRRRYYSEGILHENSSQKIDRDNLCLICQTTDPFEFKDIEIEKRNEILPYIFSSFSGEKSNPSEKIKYGKSSNRFGLGLNFDLTKNSSLEMALNPDFSQVEADISLIDVNSPVSLQYPERRPFFNRGMDIVNFNQDIFYSRSISDPIFASKLLTQKKESRFFVLTALDEHTKYLVGGEDKSVVGDLDESYLTLIRYQKILKKSRIGFISSNRIYRDKGFGSLFGLDGLIDIGNTWRVLFELFKNYRNILLNFVIQLNLKNLTLVLHEWGGTLGLTLPMENPEKYSGVICFNAYINNHSVKLDSSYMNWIKTNITNDDLNVRALMARTNRILKLSECNSYEAPFPDKSYKLALKMLPSIFPLSDEFEGYEIGLRAVEWWKQNTTTKCMLIGSAKDSIVPLEKMKSLSQIIATDKVTHVINNAGHFVPEWGMEFGEELFRQLKDF